MHTELCGENAAVGCLRKGKEEHTLMDNYIIMHKERKVASIRRDGSCTIYAPSFMPYNLYFEKAAADDMDGRMNNINNFYYWCASRLLTLDRKYAKEILNSLGKPQAVTDRERAEISISYHALSLTDVYWVRKTWERVTFSEINLYDHPLPMPLWMYVAGGMD